MSRETCPIRHSCDCCKWCVYDESSCSYKCALVIIAEAALKGGDLDE